MPLLSVLVSLTETRRVLLTRTLPIVVRPSRWPDLVLMVVTSLTLPLDGRGSLMVTLTATVLCLWALERLRLRALALEDGRTLSMLT